MIYYHMIFIIYYNYITTICLYIDKYTYIEREGEWCERERTHAYAWWQEKGRGRESIADSSLSPQPDAGLDPTSREILT